MIVARGFLLSLLWVPLIILSVSHSLVEHVENENDPRAQLTHSFDGMLPLDKQDVLNYDLYDGVQKNKKEKVVKALTEGADPNYYIDGQFCLTIVKTSDIAQLLINAGANPLASAAHGCPLAVHIRSYLFNELLDEAEELAILYSFVSSLCVTKEKLEDLFKRMEERFKAIERFQYIKRVLLEMKQ